MRSGIDSATRALYDSGLFDVHWRFKAANGSGTLITLDGRYTGGQLNLPNPNLPVGSLTLDFIREQADGTSSVAPFVRASSYNRLDDGTTYSPLLELGRLCTMEFALTAEGGARPAAGSALWYETLRGAIANVDWPERDSHRARIRCDDFAGILSDAKSETAYTYAAGTPIETAIQQVLNNNGFSDIVLGVPVATAKVLVRIYEPGIQKTVWDQIWSLAQSIGWLVWFRYVGTTATLTLFQPSRSKSVSDWTVPLVHDFTDLGIKKAEIGNVGRLIYPDASGVRQTVGPIEDAASILKYGGARPGGIRRAFWISLPDDSPVRDSTGATDLLTAAVSDCADPDAVATALTPPLLLAEAGVDLYTFPATPRLFDEDLQLAPFMVSIDFQADQDATSTTPLRGRPTAGYRTWKGLRMGGAPFRVDPAAFEDAAGTLGTLQITVSDSTRVDHVEFIASAADGTVTSALGPTRTPATGVYERDIALDAEHNVRLSAEVFLIDSTSRKVSPVTFDRDKSANILGRPTVSYSDDQAEIAVRADSDTVSLWRQESTDNGVSWGTEALIANAREGSFGLTASTTEKRLFRVYGKNAAGVAGSNVEVYVDKYVAPGTGTAPFVTITPVLSATAATASATVTGNESVASIRVAASTSATPSEAVVRAAPAHDGQTAGPSALGTLLSGLTPGQTVYLAAFGYDGSAGAGVESALSTAEARFGVGTAGIADGAVNDLKLADAAVTAAKVAVGAINTGAIQDAAVQAQKLADGAVTQVKIALAAIDSSRLSDAAVVGAKIADAAISTAKFAAGIEPVGISTAGTLPTTKTTNALYWSGNLYRWSGTAYVKTVPTTDLSGTIGTTQLADGSVTTVKIGASAVTVTQLASGAVTQAKMGSGLRVPEILGALPAAGTQGRLVLLTTDNKLYRDTGTAWTAAVPTADLSGQIIGTQITDGAVSTAQIAANAITGAKIAAGTITSGHIAANTIVSGNIAADTITAGNIAAGAIGASEIAAGAVVAGKIAAGVITATELAADAVTAGKIASGAVTAGTIAAGAVSTTALAALAVTAAKIAAGTITANEIAASTITGSNIGGLTITGANIAGTTITGGKLVAGTITSNEIASATIVAGNIAASTITGGNIAGSTITGANIAALTIQAGHIAAGTITADKISVASLSTISVDVGQVTAGYLRNAANTYGIALGNVQANVGWTRYISFHTSDYFIKHEGLLLDHSGNAYFSGSLSAATGTFAGDISAASGTFSGTVSSSSFTASICDFNSVRASTLRVEDGTSPGQEWWLNGNGTGDLVFTRTGGGIALFMKSTGRISAKGFDVYSPIPPKPDAEMLPADWIEWGVADAKKPVYGGTDGMPCATSPEVVALVDTGMDPVAALDQVEDAYRKDVSKIAIGTARWADLVYRALQTATDFASFKAALFPTLSLIP